MNNIIHKAKFAQNVRSSNFNGKFLSYNLVLKMTARKCPLVSEFYECWKIMHQKISILERQAYKKINIYRNDNKVNYLI